MKKNKFIKIILSLALVFNMTNIAPTYAMDTSQNNSSQEKIRLTFCLVQAKLIRKVEIGNKDCLISDLSGLWSLVGYPVDIIYNGSIVDLNKKVSDVFMNNTYVLIVPKDLEDKSHFMSISRRCLHVNEDMEKIVSLCSIDPNAKEKFDQLLKINPNIKQDPKAILKHLSYSQEMLQTSRKIQKLQKELRQLHKKEKAFKRNLRTIENLRKLSKPATEIPAFDFGAV